MNSIVLNILASSICVLLVGKPPVGDSRAILKPGAKLYSVSVNNSRSILTKAGFSVSDKSVLHVVEYYRPKRKRSHYLYVRFKPSVEVHLDGDTLKPYMIVNFKRMEDQYKHIGRTGKQRFTSKESALNYLRSLTLNLGYSKDLRLSSFTWTKDGEVKDGNSTGRIGATYMFKDNISRVILSVDPQDGALMLFQEDKINSSKTSNITERINQKYKLKRPIAR